MKIPALLKSLLSFYMPHIVDGDTATVDRGDDFTPTGDDADTTGTPAGEDTLTGAATDEVDETDPAAAEAAAVVAAAEAAAAEKAKTKDTRIPLSRHQEVLGKERAAREALEAEFARYKQGEKIAATNEDITKAEDAITAMEAEYNQLASDGKMAEANAKMTAIRRAERAVNDQRTQLVVQAAEARAVETVRYSTVVERFEAAYPQLNPDHADFDQAKTVELMELKTAYQALGHAPTAALQKAIKVLMPPETAAQEKVVEVAPKVDKADVAKEVAAQRRKDAAAAALKATGAQPPNTAKVGADSDKNGGGAIDAKAVMRMPYEQFAKLDDATLSKMRGDEL